jgi:hypothetical protein
MTGFRKHFDVGSLMVILLTLVLFLTALFSKGLSHDLLLEAGVFLVSVKLIMMTYKAGVAANDLSERLGQLQSAVTRLAALVDRGGCA